MDLDGDGALDLLENGSVRRNDAGTFVNASAGVVGQTWPSARWADADNDGNIELVQLVRFQSKGLMNSARSELACDSFSSIQAQMSPQVRFSVLPW